MTSLLDLRLWKGERHEAGILRSPGTDICLNCPLDIDHYTDQYGCRREVCEQVNDWHKANKKEPVCPIAFAKYYGVDLKVAEQIAKQVNLQSGKAICLDRYMFEIRLISNERSKADHLGRRQWMHYSSASG